MDSLTYNENQDSKYSEQDLEYLYKYHSLNTNNAHHRERIFTHNELYFPSPRVFNDPFDSKIRLEFEGSKNDWKTYLLKLYSEKRPDWNREQRLAEVRQIIRERRYKRISEGLVDSYLDQIGVFCMSEVKDQILMWSHYSEGHTGFCLEFRATFTTPFFGRAQKIIYSEEYPSMNFFKTPKDAQMEATLLTKANLWSYEKEWRIIEYIKGAGTYSFPPELLTGVIIGCQMSDANKTKIINWAKNRNPKPVIYKAEVKKREFGLEIEPLE